MPKIKYMGSADEAVLDKGENFGGRLQGDAVLGSRLEFNRSNNWTVDTDEVGVHEDFVTLLLENDSERFQDVSGKTRIPSSRHEQIYLGHKKTQANLAAPDGEVEPGGSQVGSGTTATVGGSTEGATGGRSGGRARATGGSTTGD